MRAMTHSYECYVSSKYGMKIKSHHHVRTYFPMVCLESQRLHHRRTCAPPHSLHQLYLSVLLLSTNLCVYHIAYIYVRTHSHEDPQPARKASWNKAGVEPVHNYRPRLTQNLVFWY